MMRNLLSRKFVLAFFAQISNVLLCYSGAIDGGVFATVTAITVGGYITGNVVQKATEKSGKDTL